MTVATRARLSTVDRIRGLAIVLMVLDHVLVVVDPTSFVRLTVTRAALPLFMATAARVWRPGLRWRRLGLMVVALVVEMATFPIVGIPAPGIMLGIIAVTLLLAVVPRLADFPLVLGVTGLCAWIYLDAGIIAVALGWWGVGRSAGLVELDDLAGPLPRFLERLGRAPLQWYCGHLLVLAVVVEAVS